MLRVQAIQQAGTHNRGFAWACKNACPAVRKQRSTYIITSKAGAYVIEFNFISYTMLIKYGIW